MYGQRRIVSPYQSEFFDIDPKLDFEIRVRCDNGSFYKKGRYYLTVETIYTCSAVGEFGLISIVHEQSGIVGTNIYFNKLFADFKGISYNTEENKIMDKEYIIKVFKRKRTIGFFLLRPFMHLIGLVTASLMLGIILLCIFGWKCAIIYFLTVYFALLIGVLIEESTDIVVNKLFKIKSEKTEFYEALEDNYVTNRYKDLRNT